MIIKISLSDFTFMRHRGEGFKFSSNYDDFVQFNRNPIHSILNDKDKY